VEEERKEKSINIPSKCVKYPQTKQISLSSSNPIFLKMLFKSTHKKKVQIQTTATSKRNPFSKW
jgi:hypothetical protein